MALWHAFAVNHSVTILALAITDGVQALCTTSGCTVKRALEVAFANSLALANFPANLPKYKLAFLLADLSAAMLVAHLFADGSAHLLLYVMANILTNRLEWAGDARSIERLISGMTQAITKAVQTLCPLLHGTKRWALKGVATVKFAAFLLTKSLGQNRRSKHSSEHNNRLHHFLLNLLRLDQSIYNRVFH